MRTSGCASLLAGDVGYVSGIVASILGAAAIVVGAYLGYRLFSRYSPRFRLTLRPSWVGDSLILGIEVENTSSVRAGRPTVHLQVLEYDPMRTLALSEWVPFVKDDVRDGEEPLGDWRDPVRVFEDTSDRVYPGEAMVVDRLAHYPGDVLLHIGLRVQINRLWRRKPHSQVTTCIARKQVQRQGVRGRLRSFWQPHPDSRETEPARPNMNMP
jgi:hypothetical protein